MIKPIEHILNLDLANKINMNKSIIIKKNDTDSHKLVVNIFNSGAGYDLTGTTAKIFFKKPDGTKVFLSCIYDGTLNNRLSAILTTQALTSVGNVATEITIYGTSGEILTSNTFNYTVNENVRDDSAIESTSEFTALIDALAVVTTISNKLDKTEFTTFKDSTVAQLANMVTKNAYKYGFKPTNTATENVLAMQTMLNTGGTIIVDYPGTYAVNSEMLINSNTTLIFGADVHISVELDGTTQPHYIFINEGARSGNKNENIKVIGYRIITNGILTNYNIPGLRGYLSFFHVKNLVVDGIGCDFYPAHVFCLHICDFENVLVQNFKLIGDKDAIHVSFGKKLTIRRGQLSTVDDAIALNAWDFYESNPLIGDIEDVLIEDITELSHTENVDTAYEYTIGYSTRLLGGCWVNWFSGMTVKHSDTVINAGKMYRVSSIHATEVASTTAPTHSSGLAILNGITWSFQRTTTALNARCKNVTIRNYTSNQIKKFGNFCFSAINEADHRSIYTGAIQGYHENITFDNINIYGYTPSVFDLRGNIREFSIINSYFDFINIHYALITMRELFGITSYITPYVLIANNKLLGGDYVKLTAAYANANSRSINIRLANNKSDNGASCIKTPTTTLLGEDACDIATNYTDRANL